MRLLHTQSNFSARAEDVSRTLGMTSSQLSPDDISITALGAVVLLGTFAQTLRALTQADVKTGKVVRS
jgi:hypothetical protein